MTFEPHPREFFYGRMMAAEAADANVDEAEGRRIAAPPTRIANLRDKLDALADCGVDRVIVERFNARFASLSPNISSRTSSSRAATRAG